MCKIDSLIMQNMINEYCKTHNAKTTRATYGFVLSVINMFYNIKFRVKLPNIIKKPEYIPTIDDVKSIIYTTDNKIRPYIYLMAYGLRIGEIYALQPCDIGQGCVHITKSVIYRLNWEKIVKPS